MGNIKCLKVSLRISKLASAPKAFSFDILAYLWSKQIKLPWWVSGYGTVGRATTFKITGLGFGSKS